MPSSCCSRRVASSASAREHQLPEILRQSRLRQASVTNELADQVLEALGLLLQGFAAAAERDGRSLLREALDLGQDHVYGGLLTVLLRLVFLLYAEDRGLLPADHLHYAEHLSVFGLHDQLVRDHGAFPDTLSRRFGAWPRLITLFRAVYLGARHGDFHLPARRGRLFDPASYPFLEGWGPAGAAPIRLAEERAAVRVPLVDDECIFRALGKLVYFEGQRLSYRALDVEQIGSVYEALMGYHVEILEGPAVCLRPARVWIAARDVVAQAPGRRAAWLGEAAELPKNVVTKLGSGLAAATTEDEVLALLETQRVRGSERGRAGQYVLQPGAERRRTSSHYTPRSLSAPIVARTLEPLLRALGEAPSSRQLLELKICDPAMGSGAFLVEACRFLADQLVAAWAREPPEARAGMGGMSRSEDEVTRARRLVAQRCLYGVDKNAFAVDLAKLSLWLVTLARDEPFTFVDHALRHGDSLVGLSLDQIRGFHWAPGAQREIFANEIDRALDEALAARQEILELAAAAGDVAARDKERLLEDAEMALATARLLGDLVVGAFFAKDSERERQKERDRRRDLVVAWLAEGADRSEVPAELRALQEEIRERLPVFHWMLEFPEVFWAERPDPLEGEKVGGQAWFDAFVGNPPFMGKNGISEAGGPAYLPWLQTIHEGAHGNADLCAHFFRRAYALLGDSGAMGLIATDTIAEGDTRTTGLKPIVDAGAVIYDATRGLLWEGGANVAVAVVHLAKGCSTQLPGLKCRLDGAVVAALNSRLRPKPERPDPVKLAANTNLAFVGTYVLGMGFILSNQDRNALVAKDSRNAERTFPFIGGEEINTNPSQIHERYVIHFGNMPLEEAEQWPDLISIVREKVKPERDRLKDNADARRRKDSWWHFGRDTPSLYQSLAHLNRCLATARITKHLCFSFQPTDRILNEKVYVFPLDRDAHFLLLQSRIHECWVRLLSSTYGSSSTSGRVLNYSASDCFETFPFPAADKLPALEDIGERLYTTRAKYMVDTQQGLTITYNLLKDPACQEPRIIELRCLHEEMDRAVLAAYGWSDIAVPAYGTPTTDAEKKALEAFEDEVIDRLFALNAERAEEERLRGATARKGAKTRAPKPSATPQLALGDLDTPPAPRPQRRRAPKK